MSKHHYTATFSKEEGARTYSRFTDNEYSHASIKHVQYEGWKVAFHSSFAAAKRRAGAFGRVVQVTRVR